MDYTNEEAYNIGKRQKAMIWLTLASIGALFVPFAHLIVAIIAIVFVYNLASAQKMHPSWMWAFLQIIPFVNLICLLGLNQKATKILRYKGVKVGLMGASSKDLKKLINK